MTAINLECNWPKTYIHITQELMNDQKKSQRSSAYNEIIKDLEIEMYANKWEDQPYHYALKAVIERIKSQI